MTWIKLEDDFPWHPKVTMAGPAGFVMAVGALCYANRYLTDGFIPRAALMTVAPVLEWEMSLEQTALRLVEVGLWEEVDGGWQIHDYAEHQRSSEQIREKRRADAERKRVGVRAESVADSNATPTRLQHPRARERATEVEVETEKESPPVVPPRGGRKRDRQRWEKDVDAYAEEHFPQLPRSDRVTAVRQAFKFGKAETPQEVTAFIREHFPRLAGQLERTS